MFRGFYRMCNPRRFYFIVDIIYWKLKISIYLVYRTLDNSYWLLVRLPCIVMVTYGRCCWTFLSINHVTDLLENPISPVKKGGGEVLGIVKEKHTLSWMRFERNVGNRSRTCSVTPRRRAKQYIWWLKRRELQGDSHKKSIKTREELKEMASVGRFENG